MNQKIQFDDNTIVKCVNEIFSRNSKHIPIFTTLSQTGFHILISDGPNRRGCINNNFDESFNTHLNLCVKVEAILADGKFNMSSEKPLAFNIDTIILQYNPQLHSR